MNNIKRYNIFILLSTLSRNIPEVYSAVLLYKMDYSLKDILLFFTVLYLLGALTSVITIYILNKIKSKYILILSSIIFSLSFYYMSIMPKTTKSLLIFSIIYSIGSYTYHTLRHYYAIKALEDNKKENIEDATYNAKALGKDNIRFVYGDSLKKMVPFAKKKDYDTVIIRGINRISDELKDTLRLGKVKTVIYVNSSTSMLAKDLQELSKYYKVIEIKAVDSHIYQSYVTSIVKLIKK